MTILELGYVNRNWKRPTSFNTNVFYWKRSLIRRAAMQLQQHWFPIFSRMLVIWLWTTVASFLSVSTPVLRIQASGSIEECSIPSQDLYMYLSTHTSTQGPPNRSYSLFIISACTSSRSRLVCHEVNWCSILCPFTGIHTWMENQKPLLASSKVWFDQSPPILAARKQRE